MSWIRLLNTSRSFTPQDGEPRGYRLTQMNLIPKFGNSADTMPRVVRSASTAPGTPGTRKIPVASPLPRAMPAPAPVTMVRSEPNRVMNTLRATVATAAEFGGRLLRRREAGPFAPTGSVRPTVAAQTAQAELKLEAVRPVHNDLSDCDYEVRPVRRPAPAPDLDLEPETMPAPARETGLLATAGEALGRVRTLFH